MEIKITLAEAIKCVEEFLGEDKDKKYWTIEISYHHHSSDTACVPFIKWRIYYEEGASQEGENFIIAFEKFKTAYINKDKKEEITVEQKSDF